VKESGRRDFELAKQLELVIRKGLGRRQWEFILLAQAWEDVVGRRAAVHCMPAWIKKDVLWGYVDSSSWMQELTFMKPDILQKVCQHVRSVCLTDIRWIQNPVEQRSLKNPEESVPDRVVAPEEEDAFRNLTEVVDEPGCRKALFHLWQTFQRKMR